MKKKIKNILKKIIITIVTVLSVTMIFSIVNENPTFADSGHGTSHSSSHSSHSSSSSSRSRSSSRSSSRTSSSSSSSGDPVSAFISIIIYIIFIIIITVILSKKNQHVKVVVNKKDEKVVEDEIKKLIPNFDKYAFLKEGFNIYYDIQMAWMNFKLEDIKDKVTDEIYNMYESQLVTLEVKGEQNIMKDFKVVKSYLKDAVVQNNTITITTGYVIQMYDYIIEKSTGKVIRGSSNNKLKIVYEMKFRRTLDENAKIDKCPNCGAKIDMNTSGICEYCGSKLVSENTKWVLTEKKTIRQETI